MLLENILYLHRGYNNNVVKIQKKRNLNNINIAIMDFTKIIEGTDHWGNIFEYEINGKQYSIQGELYYNKKKERYEHIHVGPRGGEYLIWWK